MCLAVILCPGKHRNQPRQDTQRRAAAERKRGMINYIFILLAVTCFTAQFAFTKLYENRVGQAMSGTLVMLVGTNLVGALIFLFVGGFRVAVSPVSVFWAVIFAIIMMPYFLIGIKVLSIGSLAIYSMFMMLGGMLVPFFYGVLILHEEISVPKIIGTVLLALFIILQAISQDAAREKSGTQKKKYLFFALCLLIFFINGMTGVVTKAHSVSEGAVDEVSFTVLSCALTALFSGTALLIKHFRNGSETANAIRRALKGKALLVMVLLGGAAYGGNFLMLLAANKVPASVQFPLVSGGAIVLSAIVSQCVFKEKMSKLEWCSIIGAFASTFLFAI